MLISTETASFRKFGDLRKILTALYTAGFDAYDATMDGFFEEILDRDDYRSAAKSLRWDADAIGILCNQAHAPAPTWYKGDENFNGRLFAQIVRCMETASILGAKIIVVHPNEDVTPEENAEFYLRLEPYAREFGIKIALENMWNAGKDETGFRAAPAACYNAESFCSHLALLPEDIFVACLDFGHAEMFAGDASCMKMIPALGSRLQAVHLHDNDCRHDEHELPFSRSMDWDAILPVWKDSGYTGDVTLEARSFTPKYPVELYPVAMAFMAQTADLIRKRMR